MYLVPALPRQAEMDAEAERGPELGEGQERLEMAEYSKGKDDVISAAGLPQWRLGIWRVPNIQFFSRVAQDMRSRYAGH